MKKNIIFKFIITLLISITLIMTFSQPIFAKGIKIDIDKLEKNKDNSDATNHMANIIGAVINVIQVIGMGVAIIMLVVIGITWLGASPSGKAQIAKTSRIYIVGAVLIFTATGLLNIIKKFVVSAKSNAGV